jgi:hypothetical protein
MASGTFNLSNSSQSIHYDRFLLTKYGAKLKNLKILVYPISATSFFFNPDMDATFAYNYRIYLGCTDHPIYSKYNWEFCRPDVFIGKIEAALMGKVRTCNLLGFGTDYTLASKKIANQEELTALDRAKYHTIDDWQFYDANVKDFVWILNYCQEHFIQVVLIRTPLYRKYFEALPQNQLVKTKETLDSLAQFYDFKRLDYAQDPRVQSSDDFFDCNHLSDVGSKKFSLILKEDLSKL